MFVDFSLADPNYQGITNTNHRTEYATTIMVLNRSLLIGKYKLCSTYALHAFEGRKMFLGDVVEKRINLVFMVSDVPTRTVLGCASHRLPGHAGCLFTLKLLANHGFGRFRAEHGKPTAAFLQSTAPSSDCLSITIVYLQLVFFPLLNPKHSSHSRGQENQHSIESARHGRGNDSYVI